MPEYARKVHILATRIGGQTRSGLAITSLPLWFVSMMIRDHEALADGFLPDSETGVCNSSFGDEKLVSNDGRRDREKRGGVLCYTYENHQRGRAG